MLVRNCFAVFVSLFLVCGLYGQSSFGASARIGNGMKSKSIMLNFPSVVYDNTQTGIKSEFILDFEKSLSQDYALRVSLGLSTFKDSFEPANEEEIYDGTLHLSALTCGVCLPVLAIKIIKFIYLFKCN